MAYELLKANKSYQSATADKKLTLRTVRSGPVAFANARAGLQIVGAVLGAAGQALVHLLVDGAAVFALPAGLAVALAVDARPVAGARRIDTVGCVRVVSVHNWLKLIANFIPCVQCGSIRKLTLIAEFALPAAFAVAFALDAAAVRIAAGHLAFAGRHLAFRALPALLAVAHSAAVVAVAGAQHRTDAWMVGRTEDKKKGKSTMKNALRDVHCDGMRRWNATLPTLSWIHVRADEYKCRKNV